MKRLRRDRYLTLLEVADLMKVPHREKPPREDQRLRRQDAYRMVRALEKRDGVPYMRSRGPRRPGSRLFVSVAAVEQLAAWDPGTLTAMREDIDVVAVQVRRAERRLDGHDRDITALKLIQQKAAEFADAVNMALTQSASQATQKTQLPRETSRRGRVPPATT